MLGILGGQGAHASACVHDRLVSAWALSRSCRGDEDYPSILHLSQPLPGVGLSGFWHDVEALAALRTRALMLKQWGATFIAVACNSLDELASELTVELGLPVASPWQCAKATWGSTPLAVLCSSSRYADLKLRPMPLWRIPCLDDQLAVSATITDVVRGDLPAAACRLIPLVERLTQAGHPVLLGCTELSCLFPLLNDYPLVLDAIDPLIIRMLSPRNQPPSTED
jgi:aspartate/glutamate racemase